MGEKELHLPLPLGEGRGEGPLGEGRGEANKLITLPFHPLPLGEGRGEGPLREG